MLICTGCNELSSEDGEEGVPDEWLWGTEGCAAAHTLDRGLGPQCTGTWVKAQKWTCVTYWRPKILGVVERNERLNHITPPPVLANAVIGTRPAIDIQDDGRPGPLHIPVPVAPVPPAPAAPPWVRPAGVKGSAFPDPTLSAPAPATKPTNPKDAVGIKKTPFWLVPATIVGEIALALLEGARKYGAYNWRVAGVRASVYISAAEGHMKDWWEGEDTDPESQLSHITKALASLTVLRDAMLQGMWEDDRPPKSKVLPRQGNNARAAEIIERVRPHDPVAPFTAKKGE